MDFTYPSKRGKVDIFPEIHEGNIVVVSIFGDPDGLKYLADLLVKLADFDQELGSFPTGSREHIHLHKDAQLGSHSCEVEIYRADAKGTGEFPHFMQD